MSRQLVGPFGVIGKTRYNRRDILIGSLGAAMLPSSLKAMEMTSARDAGFHLPEEAEPHARTFMQWPVSPIVHPDRVFLDMLQQAIADIANTIAEFEPVVMLMDRRFENAARRGRNLGRADRGFVGA